MEYYSAIRSDEILPFATTWMGLEIIMLSEISQTEKVGKSHDTTSLWDINLKAINEQDKKRLRDMDNGLVVTRG